MPDGYQSGARQHGAILRRWASVSQSGRRSTPEVFAALKHLIDIAGRRVTLDHSRLSSVLDRCQRALNPLSEPFVDDYGTHRWLRGDREEAYSDWLAWILERLGTGNRILAVLGAPRTEASWGNLEARVVREYIVEAGHVDQAGRVDIQLTFEDQAVIWIEVKVTSADVADMEKNAGYSSSQAIRCEPHKARFAIATRGLLGVYDGFEFRSWLTICTGLRSAAIEFRDEGAVSAAAMTLAFVGAVEQNLLGFPVRLLKRARSNTPIWSCVEIADHLDSWLKNVEGGPAV